VIEILPTFLPHFFAGLVVNVEIASLSLMVGLLVGVPLVAMLQAGRVVAVPTGGLVSALRAAPTFVVMFFLLNAIPPQYTRNLSLFGDWSMTAVILSQAVYAISYVADNGLVAARALRAGDTAKAALFLPSLARAFCVLLMSSGMAAAVGIQEAISITIREAERMPNLGDRVQLFLVVMVFFAVTLQCAFALINRLRFHLARILARRSREACTRDQELIPVSKETPATLLSPKK